MVDGVVALRLVVGVGVGEEGFAACFLDSADYVVDEERLHVVRVAQLAHMQLDGDEVAFLYAVERARRIVQAVRFLHQVKRGVPRNEMNCHDVKPP